MSKDPKHKTSYHHHQSPLNTVCNTFYSFNFTSQQWVEVHSSSNAPPPREFHTCVVFGDSMFLFCGSDGSRSFNDCFVYNFLSRKWTCVDRRLMGNLPPHREAATTVVYQDRVYLFGGKGDLSCMNDLYNFHCLMRVWQKISATGQIPSKRYQHTAVVYGNSMWVFGGKDNYGFLYNDLHEFSFTSNKWTKIDSNSKEIPSKRDGHSAVVCGDSMIIYGGYDKHEQYCNDCFEYNFSTQQWRQIITETRIPQKRYGHTAVVKDKNMIVFGGACGASTSNSQSMFSMPMECLDLSTFEWKKISVKGNIPSNRKGHSAVVYGDNMYVFGGTDYRLLGLQELLSKLCKILLEKPFTDVEFLVEKKKIPAHVCIVSQSEVLYKKIKASNSPIIEIKDTSAQTFENLLKYMYSGIFDTVYGDNYAELVQAAHIYKLDELKRRCFLQFDHIVNVETVLSMLVKFHEYQLEPWKSLCLQFFYKHKEQIIKDQKLNNFPNELLLELLQISTLKKPPEIQHEMYGKEHGLLKHLLRLYDTKEFSDIILISNDGQSFQAHKALLVAFSDYFSSLLKKNKDKIFMDELDKQTLDLILKFIYTNDVELPDCFQGLMEMIKAANMLHLEPLKEHAAKRLVSFVSPQNALTIIQCCVAYNIKGELKDRCWKIIRGSNFLTKEELIQNFIEQQWKFNSELSSLKKIIHDQNQQIIQMKAQFEELEKQFKKLQNN